jgi:hypothetical protein
MLSADDRRKRLDFFPILWQKTLVNRKFSGITGFQIGDWIKSRFLGFGFLFCHDLKISFAR